MKLNWSELRNRPLDVVNDFLFYGGEVLVGYLALYGFGKREVEISAMVDPEYRQQGIFKALLSASRREVEARGIPDLLFISEQKSIGGQATMRAIGAKYHFTEYQMALKRPSTAIVTAISNLAILPATPRDVPFLAHMDELCFQIPAEISNSRLKAEISGDRPRQARVITLSGQIIGKIHIVDSGSEIYIAGFCILPEYRGKGLGTAVLSEVVAELVSAGHQHIYLEVETSNVGALSIYERCGFEIVTAYDYFRLPVATVQIQT